MELVTIDRKRIDVLEAIRLRDLGASSKHGDKIAALVHQRSNLQRDLHSLRNDYFAGARGEVWAAKVKAAEEEIRDLEDALRRERATHEPLRETSSASGHLYNRCVEYLESLK